MEERTSAFVFLLFVHKEVEGEGWGDGLAEVEEKEATLFAGLDGGIVDKGLKVEVPAALVGKGLERKGGVGGGVGGDGCVATAL